MCDNTSKVPEDQITSKVEKQRLAGISWHDKINEVNCEIEESIKRSSMFKKAFSRAANE